MVKHEELPESELSWDDPADFVSIYLTCPCGEDMTLTPDANPESCPRCGRNFWARMAVHVWREVI